MSTITPRHVPTRNNPKSTPRVSALPPLPGAGFQQCPNKPLEFSCSPLLNCLCAKAHSDPARSDVNYVSNRLSRDKVRAYRRIAASSCKPNADASIPSLVFSAIHAAIAASLSSALQDPRAIRLGRRLSSLISGADLRSTGEPWYRILLQEHSRPGAPLTKRILQDRAK